MTIRQRRMMSFIIVLTLLFSSMTGEQPVNSYFDQISSHSTHTTISHAASHMSEEACTVEMLTADGGLTFLYMTGRNTHSGYSFGRHIHRSFVPADMLQGLILRQTHDKQAFLDRLRPFRISALVVSYVHRSDGKKKS